LPRVPPARWQDTRVVLPRSLRGGDFFDALTGAPASLRSDGLLLSSLLKHGPVALVVNRRGA
ncbi:MAG: AarF/ABC1/UbiB kinase family protein, partial [Gammaproteobacteria bacterium]